MLEIQLGRPLLKRKPGPPKKVAVGVVPIVSRTQKSLGFE
jgi:hypothetical protein